MCLVMFFGVLCGFEVLFDECMKILVLWSVR